MPASEFLEWMEYERVEPFGSWRDNYHAALSASILANVHRKPGTPPVPLSDFFYTDPETSAEKQDEMMLAFFESKVCG